VTREWSDLFETAERDREIAAIRERLARLESEKSNLEARLDRLLSAQEAMDGSPVDQGCCRDTAHTSSF
jgi:predicted nuclease with TOPRIM domain